MKHALNKLQATLIQKYNRKRSLRVASWFCRINSESSRRRCCYKGQFSRSNSRTWCWWYNWAIWKSAWVGKSQRDSTYIKRSRSLLQILSSFIDEARESKANSFTIRKSCQRRMEKKGRGKTDRIPLVLSATPIAAVNRIEGQMSAALTCQTTDGSNHTSGRFFDES
jgi:hypothetical protein